MFARPAEMEPGHWFRESAGGVALEWLGVEPVVIPSSRRRWVRVLVGRGGRSFICDPSARFQIIEWTERR